MARNQWQAMQDSVAGLTQALQSVVQGGNQAAAARNGAGDLHQNFRSLNPPRFSGSPDPDEAENWQKEMNEFSKSSWRLGSRRSSTPSRSSSPSRLLRPAQTVHLKSIKGDYEVQEEEQVEDGNESE
ncbi:hypothetical protein Taro_013532 [Colocasia esculenta]|uniref:Uncharacterized protein n=1 Tax=Colocasia esculenta TaxID=4460 RepID=A0A843U6S9_COLES|nr:hypothetical protein [Colocasia esculenta]